jgi:hypothetical protein
MTLEGKLIIHAQNNSAFGTWVRSDIKSYPIIHTYTTAFKTETSHEHSSLKLISLNHYIKNKKKRVVHAHVAQTKITIIIILANYL